MSLTGSASEVTNLDALCGKISRVSPYSIDTSLSQVGAAAEAKATGVAIANAKAGIDGHLRSKDNPHGVTKAQIGLDNVDNTADVEKPVSVPQKEALDKKVDKATNKGLSTNDFTDAYRDKLDGIEEGANKYSLSDGEVTKEKIADKAVTAEKVNDTSRTQYFSATLTVDGWTGDAAPYTQTVTDVKSDTGVAMTENDRPKVYLVPPETFADVEAAEEAYGLLYDVNSGSGTATFKAKEKPTVAINVALEVNRI